KASRKTIFIRTGAILLSTLLCAAGCAKYESAPITQERVEKDLSSPNPDDLKLATSKLDHPILKPLAVHLEKGLSPDDAAIRAVIANPSLRAERERRNVAAAQLVQAGLLPNPQFVGTVDFPHGSNPP